MQAQVGDANPDISHKNTDLLQAPDPLYKRSEYTVPIAGPPVGKDGNLRTSVRSDRLPTIAAWISLGDTKRFCVVRLNNGMSVQDAFIAVQLAISRELSGSVTQMLSFSLSSTS